MRHKVKGIVLREIPKGETSKLLTVLTSTLGVITVNAKGVGSLTSPYLKCSFQFAFSDILLYEKNGFYTLTEAALIADFYYIRKDIKNYSLACYLCDVASDFATPGEEGAKILRLLLNSLYAIENNISNRQQIKAAFELRICSECGFLPEIESCAFCGNELQGREFVFNTSEGVSACRECAQLGRENILVSAGVGEAINHICNTEISRIVSFRLRENDYLLLSKVAERYLLARAERGFKTLSFYKHCEELE